MQSREEPDTGAEITIALGSADERVHAYFDSCTHRWGGAVSDNDGIVVRCHAGGREVILVVAFADKYAEVVARDLIKRGAGG